MTDIPPTNNEQITSPGSLLIGARAPVTRYRPMVIAGGLLVILLLVGLGFAVAFGGAHRPKQVLQSAQDDGVDAALSPELGQGAPRSYADATARPGAQSAESAETSDNPQPPSASAPKAALEASRPPAMAADLRSAQDQARAAHEGSPFFGVNAVAEKKSGAPNDPLAAPSPSPAASSPPTPPLSPKEAFVATATSGQDYVSSSQQTAKSPYEVKAGTIIPAALITGLNSDLPGEVVAQVTQTVYDFVSGRYALIPQGTRLLGRYDSQTTYGQDRALVVWNRLIFPDGRSINIGTMTGVDSEGASGVSDRVDAHLPLLLRAIGFSSLVTVGGVIAQNASTRSTGNLVLQDAAGGVSSSASQIGQKFIDRDLGRQPTINVRPGFRINVLVSKDMILSPYPTHS